jgi:ubiquinone/menaquinone biosynthesis C-methylase UbiE
MLASARRTLGPAAALTHAEDARIPFADGVFDAVVCTHCFHHFPDQSRAVREIRRVLRRGGAAYILDGDRDRPWGGLIYDVLVSWAEGGVHHRSAADMLCLTRAAGFADIHQFRGFRLSPVLLTIARK